MHSAHVKMKSMKYAIRIIKIVSVILSVLGIVLSLQMLAMGVESTGASGLARLGVIFILPSLLFLLFSVFDLIVATSKAKGGIRYSYISTIARIVMILLFFRIFTVEEKFAIPIILVSLPPILNIITKKSISARNSHERPAEKN